MRPRVPAGTLQACRSCSPASPAIHRFTGTLIAPDDEATTPPAASTTR